MKKFLILILIQFSYSALAESNSARGCKILSKSVFTQPCSPKNSPFDLVASLSQNIDKRLHAVEGSSTFTDDNNVFNSVGMLNFAGAKGGHASGTVVGIKDKNGNVSRDKVVTAAHALFDFNGNLKYPIESIEFLLGKDVNDEDYSFGVKKIECIDYRRDQCIVTLDREVPPSISPLEPASDDNVSQYIKKADYLYFVGYPSWVPKSNGKRWGNKGQRFFSQCKRSKKLNKNQYAVGCNLYAAQSGGAFIASKKMKDGSWKDYYLGLPTALDPNRGGKFNLADLFKESEIERFNKIVITSGNQNQ